MKRIEVKLSLPVVAPLLDVIRGAAEELDRVLAAPQQLSGLDVELRTAWQDELLHEQQDGCRRFLALFDSGFFANGVVGFDESNAESVLRTCSALRLCLREHRLQDLPDEVLESGQIDVEQLADSVRKAFMGYVFLATLQELIIQHLDGSILGGNDAA